VERCISIGAKADEFSQYVNPIGLEKLEWRFYFVYIAILVIEVLCVYFLFVETKGPTLEEIAILFDGPNAALADESKLKMVPQEKAELDGAASHVERSRQ
jgi:hypothetical protein